VPAFAPTFPPVNLCLSDSDVSPRDLNCINQIDGTAQSHFPYNLGMSDEALSLEQEWQAAIRELSPEIGAKSDGPASIPDEIELRAWAKVVEVDYLPTLKDREPHAEFVERFPIEFARQHRVLALAGNADASQIEVAISGREQWQALDVVGRQLNRFVNPVFVPESEILRSINHAYQQQSSQASSLINEMDREQALNELTGDPLREDLLESTGRPPVVNLVNSILFEAVRSKASDVHVQPREDCIVVRERVDGVLFDTITIPKDYQDEVISRLKVLAKMNIAEKRLPQDGRASVQVGDRVIDLRVASLPTSFGERVVVRFLDKSARLYTLEELGMDAETLVRFRRLIKQEHGLLLVTGPTGGGKSTTLYAALQEINSKDLNVLTLEDPIEYQLDGISQTQINTKKGLTFASGLRNVLRQDPDIIMVGEIRDEETAIMAIQSALTGHFVFSTLHTNDAASAVTRLLDLGIESFLVSSSVTAVAAQRLVRKICSSCRESKKYSKSELQQLGLPAEFERHEFFVGAGCKECRETGHQGRLGVFELLEINEDIRDLVQARANASRIREAGSKCGMKSLYHDGIAKAKAGITTLEEVARVTMRE